MTALIIAATAEAVPLSRIPVGLVPPPAPVADEEVVAVVDLKKREAEAEGAKYANYYGTGTFADFF